MNFTTRYQLLKSCAAACFLMLIASLSLAQLPAQMPAQIPSQPLVQAIDALVAKEGVKDDTPGVAICIIQPGKWKFVKCYGMASLENDSQITPQTIFELASLSKPMTATAVLMLHERGKLSIEDDVRKLLPELPRYDAKRPIRIKDLLHHVSGLPDYMDFENVPTRNKDFWVNEDYASAFADNLKEYPLTFPTGAKHEYNNSNYMLLALIVARVSGKSFADFMRDEVFMPAGMKDTFVYENPSTLRPVAERQPAAVGYRPARGGKWRTEWGLPPERHEKLLAVGDGGVWTNIEDAARWDAAWRSGKFLKAATFKSMLEPSRTTNGKQNNYGYGFAIYPGKSGLNGFGHNGDWGGFRTDYYRYLQDDRSTIMLSNRGDFDTDRLWYKLNSAIDKHSDTVR